MPIIYLDSREYVIPSLKCLDANLYWVSKPDDNSIRKKVSSAELKEAYITNTDQILIWPADCSAAGCRSSNWYMDKSCFTSTCITNIGGPDKTILFDNSSDPTAPWKS